MDLRGLQVLGHVVDRCPHAGCRWTYTTIVAVIPGRPAPIPGNWESELLVWTERPDLDAACLGTGGPPLHAGLLRTLPAIVEVATAR